MARLDENEEMLIKEMPKIPGKTLDFPKEQYETKYYSVNAGLTNNSVLYNLKQKL